MTEISDLKGCARCGGNHLAALPLKEFHRPVVEDGDELGPYTHWATCPETGDPILVRSIKL